MKRAIILMTLVACTQAYAGDWINVLGLRVCTSDWSLEDKKIVSDLQLKLQKRSFELTEQVYEGEGIVSTKTASELKLQFPPESHFEGEHLVFPYFITFTGKQTITLNEKFNLTYSLVGCDGGDITIFNILNAPNNSRFSGVPTLNGSKLYICDGDCDGPLKPGQFRYTYRFIERI